MALRRLLLPAGSRAGRRAALRRLAAVDAGQASVDWIATVAVVATVFAAAGGTAAAAPGIVNGLHRGIERAFCLVTGQGCVAAEVHACAISSRRTDAAMGVKVAVFRISHAGAIVRTTLSDGTVELTLLEGGDVGAEVSVGGKGRADAQGHGGRLGATVTAAVLAGADRARTWRVHGAAAADALQARLREHLAGHVTTPLAGIGGRLVEHAIGRGAGRALPVADVDAYRGRGSLGGHGEAGVGEDDALGGDLSGAADVAVSRAVDRRTGRRTYALELSGEAAWSLRALTEPATGDADAAATLSLIVDRTGRPLLVSSVEHGGAALPADAPPPRAGADAVEVTRSVDLTADAGAAARVAELVAALRAVRPDRVVAAARALAPSLAAGQVDVRAYDVAQRTIADLGGEVSAGPGVGAGASWTRTNATLRDAWTRPEDGVWEQRADCLGHAAT